jgi:hypothetical protein
VSGAGGSICLIRWGWIVLGVTIGVTTLDSAADAVRARVQAYQEIKRKIMRVRDAG